MGAPDVGKILSRWPYSEAAVAAYSTAMTAAFSNRKARAIIEKALDDYAADRVMDARAVLSELGSLAPDLHLHEYTLKMLPYIALLDSAWEKFRERDIPWEVYLDSFADLLWKTAECMRFHGICGSAAAFWHWRFFELKCFGLGRLQFEVSEYKGAQVLNTHIPSSGRLRHEDCVKSYRRAMGFFGLNSFVCDSWLLHPVCGGLDKTSGIRAFASDYELQFITDDPKFLDVWNIFGAAFSGDYSDLPSNTSLQRLWKGYLMAGGVPGRGFGLYNGGEL